MLTWREVFDDTLCNLSAANANPIPKLLESGKCSFCCWCARNGETTSWAWLWECSLSCWCTRRRWKKRNFFVAVGTHEGGTTSNELLLKWTVVEIMSGVFRFLFVFLMFTSSIAWEGSFLRDCPRSGPRLDRGAILQFYDSTIQCRVLRFYDSGVGGRTMRALFVYLVGWGKSSLHDAVWLAGAAYVAWRNLVVEVQRVPSIRQPICEAVRERSLQQPPYVSFVCSNDESSTKRSRSKNDDFVVCLRCHYGSITEWNKSRN